MSGPYGKDYGLAFFLDRPDDRGRAHVVSHPGYFGTTPWLDEDRELVGILLVQSNFLRIIPFVGRIQEKVRAIVPVRKSVETLARDPVASRCSPWTIAPKLARCRCFASSDWLHLLGFYSVYKNFS